MKKLPLLVFAATLVTAPLWAQAAPQNLSAALGFTDVSAGNCTYWCHGGAPITITAPDGAACQKACEDHCGYNNCEGSLVVHDQPGSDPVQGPGQ